MRYFGELVRTLKPTVSPWFTLMSVANPWIEGSPLPLTSHSVESFPGLQFSATILLAGAAHGSAGAGGAACLGRAFDWTARPSTYDAASGTTAAIVMISNAATVMRIGEVMASPQCRCGW